MKNIHLVIPDLFLPQQLANYACGDVPLPALEKLLARADDSPLNTDTLESWLCRHFAVEGMAIAPLTLAASGAGSGLEQHDELVLDVSFAGAASGTSGNASLARRRGPGLRGGPAAAAAAIQPPAVADPVRRAVLATVTAASSSSEPTTCG